MIYNFILVLIAGYLSFNNTLTEVGHTRQNKAVEIEIDKNIDITKYECLLGVPYGYKHLIGKELYFISFKHGTLGPWLVTDVEAKNHAGYMNRNGLVADTNCEQYVHDKGVLILWETVNIKIDNSQMNGLMKNSDQSEKFRKIWIERIMPY